MSLLHTPITWALRPRPTWVLPTRINYAHSFHRPQSRALHIGATFNHVAGLTAETISSVHAAGLPWYITIPLVASAVNFTVRLPLQYYARSIFAKRHELSPLINAWHWRHRMASHAVMSGAKSKDTLTARVKISRLAARSTGRIYKKWGVQGWKSLIPLFSMVPFVCVSEALRRLSGVSVRVAGFTVEAGTDAVNQVSSAATAVVDNVMDPSLAEGGLLWFTDLTLADPYMALPVLCSAVVAIGSWRGMTTERLLSLFTTDPANQPKDSSPMKRGLQRILLLMPLFPLFLSHLPSAIFLYWLTTFSLTHFNDLLLKRLVPMKDIRLKPPGNLEIAERAYLKTTYAPGMDSKRTP